MSAATFDEVVEAERQQAEAVAALDRARTTLLAAEGKLRDAEAACETATTKTKPARLRELSIELLEARTYRDAAARELTQAEQAVLVANGNCVRARNATYMRALDEAIAPVEDLVSKYLDVLIRANEIKAQALEAWNAYWAVRVAYPQEGHAYHQAQATREHPDSVEHFDRYAVGVYERRFGPAPDGLEQHRARLAAWQAQDMADEQARELRNHGGDFSDEERDQLLYVIDSLGPAAAAEYLGPVTSDVIALARGTGEPVRDPGRLADLRSKLPAAFKKTQMRSPLPFTPMAMDRRRQAPVLGPQDERGNPVDLTAPPQGR